ncbi:MAG: ROK family protein [Anaerolineales bacterium]|nr:ROK family protein [Anaerolineales bacterium]MBK8822942.1 ROK family protein [Anaerolineales bacterium]
MPTNSHPLFGGIEGGGTKFVCAVGTGPNDIRAEVRFPTTTPEETMSQAVKFFKQQEENFGKLASIGFASFGPLDPHPDSPTYGYILPTPKPGWTNANVVGMVRSAFDIPIAFDTDVNGAALGEWKWGKGQGLNTFIYLTIGTGIGGGVFVEGKLLHGLLHPELGHIPLPHDRTKDPFDGVCPFHGDCFEGLATGVSIEKRWGQRSATLPPEHPAWDLEVEYISHALTAYSYTLSPQRIILGGGVGQLPHMLPRIQQRTQQLINGYIKSPAILENIETYIVNPGLGNLSGVLGAIALGRQALSKN